MHRQAGVLVVAALVGGVSAGASDPAHSWVAPLKTELRAMDVFRDELVLVLDNGKDPKPHPALIHSLYLSVTEWRKLQRQPIVLIRTDDGATGRHSGRRGTRKAFLDL